MRVNLSGLMLLGVLLVSPAWATTQNQSPNHYRWTDGSGQLHISDSLTVEATQVGYDVITSQGFVTAHVSKQLTQPELLAKKKMDDEQTAKQAKLNRQRQSDEQMLNAYPVEADFVKQQADSVKSIDGKIKATELSLTVQTHALSDLLQRAAEFDTSKTSVPAPLAKKVKDQQSIVNSQKNLLSNQRAERDELKQAQVEELKHYRQLRAVRA